MEKETFSFVRAGNELRFEAEDGRIFPTGFNGYKFEYKHNQYYKHAYVAVFDKEQLGDRGNRYVRLGEEFRYVSRREERGKTSSKLYITEENERLRVETEYTLYDGAAVFSSKRKITNISEKDICLEQCSALTVYGFFEDSRDAYIYKPLNSNFNECQWRRISLADEGIYELDPGYGGVKRTVMSNNGSQSSKEFLPMGILERGDVCLMWQIMSDSIWSFEAGLSKSSMYLNIAGGAYANNGWLRTLRPHESYDTLSVQCTLGCDVEHVIWNMTDVRRILHEKPIKNTGAVIFNEFMHCSWADANETRTREVSENVKNFGVDYYVIDAAWHDETCDTNPTHMIGNWEESKTRFKSGLGKTLAHLRDCGFKVGLWVEVQSVGIKCTSLPLGEESFFSFRGNKTVHNTRYHVDFRSREAIEWADGVIAKIIGKYGVDYIKIDYNQFSYGTDYNAENTAAALEEHSRAYISWFRKIAEKYPVVVFESCASGGQSINPLNLSVCDLMSTSDMESHTGYAHIATNICSAILPEQAAVWCYPRTSRVKDAASIQAGDVAINMVNPMFSRIHLAGKFYELGESNLALVREGLDYYRKLTSLGREKFYPVFPCGFSKAENPVAVGGIKCGKSLFLSVYKLDGEKRSVTLNLQKYGRGRAKVGFPLCSAAKVGQKGCTVTVDFDESPYAVIVEYKLE